VLAESLKNARRLSGFPLGVGVQVAGINDVAQQTEIHFA
jgi:hypothetical protein